MKGKIERKVWNTSLEMYKPKKYIKQFTVLYILH